MSVSMDTKQPIHLSFPEICQMGRVWIHELQEVIGSQEQTTRYFISGMHVYFITSQDHYDLGLQALVVNTYLV